MRAEYKYLGPAKRNPHTVFAPTRIDLLWLGRAFVGEHGMRANRDHVKMFVWCMTNRFLLGLGNRHWEDFNYMLRRFSQPVNPRWQRDGDLALKRKDSPMCTEAHFQRRERICGLGWLDLPLRVREELLKFLAGSLGRLEMPSWADGQPDRWSNFAAASKRLEIAHPEGLNVGGNWYFEDPHLRRGSVVIDLWS